MQWLKSNAVFVVFLLAIVLSFLVNQHDSQVDDARQTRADVQACLRTTERAALEAAFQYDAADAREKDGNLATADKYRAVANQIIYSLPGTAGLEAKKMMAELRFYRDSAGVMHAELTHDARKLQRSACSEAFA